MPKLITVGKIFSENIATPIDDTIAAVTLTIKAIAPGLVAFLTIQTYILRL